MIVCYRCSLRERARHMRLERSGFPFGFPLDLRDFERVGQIGHKPNTNRTQIEHKLDTKLLNLSNRTQTGHKPDTN